VFGPRSEPDESISHPHSIVIVVILLRPDYKTGSIHNKEVHNSYASPNIHRVIEPRRMRWTGHVAHMEEMKNVYRILLRESEGKRPHGIPGHRWEDNIRMDLGEIRWWTVCIWLRIETSGRQL
jgi:hypothetical protein